MWASHQAHYGGFSWAVPGLVFFQAPGEEVARSKEGFLSSLLFQSPIPWIPIPVSVCTLGWSCHRALAHHANEARDSFPPSQTKRLVGRGRCPRSSFAL